jgi:hypothetical protein
MLSHERSSRLLFSPIMEAVCPSEIPPAPGLKLSTTLGAVPSSVSLPPGFPPRYPPSLVFSSRRMAIS